MSQRFISNVALAIAGAVVVVSTQAFASQTAGWVTFGVSLGALALLAMANRDGTGDRMRGFSTPGLRCSHYGRRSPPWCTAAQP